MRIYKLAKRTVAVLSIALFWLWAGAKMAMDWIARSTVAESVNQARGLLGRGAEWLLATPWWVPAILASALTLVVAFPPLSRNQQPRAARRDGEDGSLKALPAIQSEFARIESFVSSIFLPTYDEISVLLLNMCQQQIKRASRREANFYRTILGAVYVPARDETAFYRNMLEQQHVNPTSEIERIWEAFARLYSCYLRMKQCVYVCFEMSPTAIPNDESFRRWAKSDENLAFNLDIFLSTPRLSSLRQRCLAIREASAPINGVLP
jgi:hypothetical protein